MGNGITYISVGDFVDLYFKIRNRGIQEISSKLKLSGNKRVSAKWNSAVSSSDFWIIPEVRARWNEKCTGNPSLEYEDYVVQTYLTGKSGLQMLSVGCGSGARERKFGKYPHFESIEGIDIAEQLIEEAQKIASQQNLRQLKYFAGDFSRLNFKPESYDLILFNSSLHHFGKIGKFIPDKIVPLLKEGGLLIIFEYVGPNRLQWTTQQLKAVNRLLREIPASYRQRFRSTSIKKRIYRPGMLRMKLVDPSEAIDSASILPTIQKHLNILEEKNIGWDITHLLLKDIAHNFLDQSKETQQWLSFIFSYEDDYLKQKGTGDAVFGVYQKLPVHEDNPML